MNMVIHEGEPTALRVEQHDGAWYLVTEYDGSYTLRSRLANTRAEAEERLAEAAAGMPEGWVELPLPGVRYEDDPGEPLLDGMDDGHGNTYHEPMPRDTPEVEAWTRGER